MPTGRLNSTVPFGQKYFGRGLDAAHSQAGSAYRQDFMPDLMSQMFADEEYVIGILPARFRPERSFVIVDRPAMLDGNPVTGATLNVILRRKAVFDGNGVQVKPAMADLVIVASAVPLGAKSENVYAIPGIDFLDRETELVIISNKTIDNGHFSLEVSGVEYGIAIPQDQYEEV